MGHREVDINRDIDRLLKEAIRLAAGALSERPGAPFASPEAARGTREPTYTEMQGYIQNRLYGLRVKDFETPWQMESICRPAA